MTLYDEIYEIAEDDHGLVTAAQAIKLGGAYKDLNRMVKDGRLTRIGHGVYRIKHHTPEPNDAYAECVAIVDSDAYLYGESVLAMHKLTPTNPNRIYVATPKRVRKSLPQKITLVKSPDNDEVTNYDGVPSQSIPAAIRACEHTMMPDRLVEAVKRARNEGLIFAREEAVLLEEIG